MTLWLRLNNDSISYNASEVKYKNYCSEHSTRRLKMIAVKCSEIRASAAVAELGRHITGSEARLAVKRAEIDP